MFCGCSSHRYPSLHTLDLSFRQQLSVQKSFFEVEKQIIADTLPTSLILNKIFFLPTLSKNVTRKPDVYFMVLPQESIENTIAKFNSSFLKSVSYLNKNHHQLDLKKMLWTDKNLTHSYDFLGFDPEFVKLDDLVAFSEANDDEVFILPLISYFDNQYTDYDWRFKDNYRLTIAFYIFDKNQIYYAKSAGLSKMSYIENSINPKDTQFLQSEWDYLVYEALRPLLEKGVELEIRSP
jgi:hypothetical protein